MLDHITDHTARACLEALVQLHREDNEDAILSFVGGLDGAAGNPLGEILLLTLATVAKMPVQKG